MSSPTASPEPLPATLDDEEDRAVGKLFAVLLAGEYAAFYRLIDESSMAPDIPSGIAIARMAASEIAHFELLAEQVSRRGLDPAESIERYRAVFDQYHRATTPRTWLEALVKAYVGDGLAADFYTELSEMMPPVAQQVVAQVMAETGNSQFAREQVKAAIAADPALRSPLTLWGRRLLGEAVTHAQWVLAAEEGVTDLLFSGATSLNGVADFFDSITARHAERMSDMGLG
ncbi:ferritin-like fold-containing protein [Gordonia sp. L191]|uniref:ferritin-like fold-containing protein n=1 Tax=Gordonia TaxID=2053 RepID=UPI001AD71721|nr:MULTISPECIES: ferritin-like fold-containing protein [Gordonia]QTI68025.1 hydroxylase [Gordonia polyisoprenivorans]WHU48513.1 ferritin-like fold-containing protein [Gordonia sp. L191]